MGYFGNSLMLTQAPTITAGAYSAGDVVGGLLTFAVGSSFAGGNILIRHLTIGDADNEKAAMDLWFFNAAPTVIADNGAFSTVTDAEIRDTCVFHITVNASDYTTAGSNALGEKKDINRSLALTG